MRVVLVAKHLNKGNLENLYVRELNLPFLPSLGMKFNQGNSTWMFETASGMDTPNPRVKDVAYNINESAAYCLFEVTDRLTSSFWEKHPDPPSSVELSQFEEKE